MGLSQDYKTAMRLGCRGPCAASVGVARCIACRLIEDGGEGREIKMLGVLRSFRPERVRVVLNLWQSAGRVVVVA